MGGGMAQRLGTSTGYEGAATANPDVNMDESHSHPLQRPPSAEAAMASPTTRLPSGNFSSSRPFLSGNGAFSADTILAKPFSGDSGSRPSTGNGGTTPAVAFRVSSGHGLPAPAQAGVATYSFQTHSPHAAPPPARNGSRLMRMHEAILPFSFHPPDQSSGSNSVFSVNIGDGYGGAAVSPRKRTFGGADGPYGAHRDDDNNSGGGVHEYSSESRPQSRRLSVVEPCNDDAGIEQRPASSSVRLSAILRGGSAERERERPTATNGLVLHDDNG
ncbi:hypothetical protein B0H14DRAFT_3869151 [Mycena olivaceomarginata]|nr:hypothetical protein B0H14DRAFT_3869151 [Mycena olivaceomarginata]